MEYCRDAEARVLAEEALRGVGEISDGAGGERGLAGDAREVADAVAERIARLGFIEGVVDGVAGEVDAAELGDLLVERHAADEVADSIIDRERGVAIRLRHSGSIGVRSGWE